MAHIEKEQLTVISKCADVWKLFGIEKVIILENCTTCT